MNKRCAITILLTTFLATIFLTFAACSRTTPSKTYNNVEHRSNHPKPKPQLNIIFIISKEAKD